MSATLTTQRTAPALATAMAIVIGARDPPILERLLGQLNELGVRTCRHPCARPDLRQIAERRRAEAEGGIVLLYGDIVTHTEALAGLLADPRIGNGVLVAPGRAAGARPRAATRAGRAVASAALGRAQVTEPEHRRSSACLKVGAAQRDPLAETAETRRAPRLRTCSRCWSSGSCAPACRCAPRRCAACMVLRSARGDRRAVARPPPSTRTRSCSTRAVKGVDGFFTTFFVSPYSRYIARWAARRGLTPNQVTTVSMLIGILSAACFATGERWGLVAGAILLQVAFTTDCVDGQLARYTRPFSQLGAWLDATFDRAKEYVVFAGLAIGADRAGDPVWVLAGAALTLQTVRHMMDFSWHGARRALIQPPTFPPLDEPRTASARVRPGHGSARALARARRDRGRRVGQAGHRVPDRRAVRADLDHRRVLVGAHDVRRAARVGRVRRGLRPRRAPAALANAQARAPSRPRARARAAPRRRPDRRARSRRSARASAARAVRSPPSCR